MDYHKNFNAIEQMVGRYENSSVIMYGLVGTWIPVYKLYVGLFHYALEKNECKFCDFVFRFFMKDTENLSRERRKFLVDEQTWNTFSR